MAGEEPVRQEPGLSRGVKRLLRSSSMLEQMARRIYFAAAARRFGGSADYWERRYRRGGDSGAGSYGRLAAFKADVLNAFVHDHEVSSVVEFGCGDGAQLALADYPHYLGIDVSAAALDRCRQRFRDDDSKAFALYGETIAAPAELAISLDVIYHLTEDETFDLYMQRLFAAATRFVIVYSSNAEVATPEPHIRHRVFTRWVEARIPQWRLAERIPNRHRLDAGNPDDSSFADFFIFEKVAAA